MFVEAPFDRVGVDSVGPFPLSVNGNRFIIVFVDYGTRWVEAFAVPQQTSTQVAELLYEHIICRYGPPKELLSDRGSPYMSQLVHDVNKCFDITSLHTSAYHPACNGLTERTNGTLGRMIMRLVEGKPTTWDEHLPAALFACRVTPHSITGFSAFELMYGRKPRLPIDVLLKVPTVDTKDVASYEDFKTTMHEMRMLASDLLEEEQAHIAHRLSPDVWPSFCVGDLVWVYSPHIKKGKSKKLTPK